MPMNVFFYSLLRLIIICFQRSQEAPFLLGLSRIERESKRLHFSLLAGFLGFTAALLFLNAGIGFQKEGEPVILNPFEPPPTVPLLFGTLFAVMTRGALLQRAQFDGIVDLVPGIDIDEDGEPRHRPLKPEPTVSGRESDVADDVARRVVAALAAGNTPRPSEQDVELNALPSDNRS